jgi:hypothetical protein
MQSQYLYDEVGDWKMTFHDYSFVVFPAAKAYEGFLKKLFLDMRFMSEREYYGKRFRIGKALNPQLAKRGDMKKGVYNKLVGFCGDENVPGVLWDTWKKSRNTLFHYFPKEQNAINYEESGKRLQLVVSAIDQIFTTCKIKEERFVK